MPRVYIVEGDTNNHYNEYDDDDHHHNNDTYIMSFLYVKALLLCVTKNSSRDHLSVFSGEVKVVATYIHLYCTLDKTRLFKERGRICIINIIS